ncbi:hypothetical protein BDZ97DRAFT_1912658 [Flammula alnicola]|nr:hypothetical protein BDZ97DRAFT_1912658 [Flammula alnicola]
MNSEPRYQQDTVENMSLVGSAVVQAREATRVIIPRGVNSSEVASLGGKKALTPILAGSICGGLMLIIWIIGFGIYFRKRYRRKQRNRLVAAGKAAPRPKDVEVPKEKIVIPPDPAVLLGQYQPGASLFPERHNSTEGHHHLPWSHHQSYAKLNTEPSGSAALPNTPSPNRAEEATSESNNVSIVDEMTVPSNI